MTKKKINAIVVTYNRKKLLLECIEALLKQTYPVTMITIIDNASTDNTQELLEENNYLSNSKINYIKLPQNIGGAGGFFEGMSKTKELGFDYAWIMDDDVIVKEDSLEKLMEGAKKVNNFDQNFSFLASTVYGVKKEPMNVPEIDTEPTENGYSDWYKYLSDGLIPIKSATFVSLLIDYNAINKVGLPCKDYFIWGDDTEYTLRLTRYFGKAYLIGNSTVIHKRKNAKSLAIENIDDPNRIKMIWRLYRNNKINIRYYNGNTKYLRSLAKDFIHIPKLIGKKYSLMKIKQILKGDYLAIKDYSKFKKYIDEQLENNRE